jgi:hypothetical protein
MSVISPVLAQCRSSFSAVQGVTAGQPPTDPTAFSDSSSNDSSVSSGSAACDERPTVYLTIDKAEQLPAAEAVIAAMYGVPDAISSLEQQQVVHAVVIACMVQAEAAKQWALQVLQAAATSEQGLTTAALEKLVSLSVWPCRPWPSCLLQLLPTIIRHAPCCRGSTTDLVAVAAADVDGRMQQLLLSKLGNLQADEQRKEMLLALPLPAMQLLLSSDNLCVPSEDTVLYTAQQYMQAQTDAAARAAPKAALAQLVRAPRLSVFALHCATLSGDSNQQFLGAYAQQLRDLLSLKRIASQQELGAAIETFYNAPASWRLGLRQIKPLTRGVQLEWELPEEQLKQACRDSFAQKKRVDIFSPSSAPVGGVGGRLQVQCVQKEGSTVIGVYAGPVPSDVPGNTYFRFKCTVTWGNVKHTWISACDKNSSSRGYVKYLQLPSMRGDGWDDAVWAAAGLPTSGDLLLTLCVHSLQ